MIRIEFPADRRDIASAIGRALCEIGGPAVSDCTRNSEHSTVKEVPEDTRAKFEQVLKTVSSRSATPELVSGHSGGARLEVEQSGVHVTAVPFGGLTLKKADIDTLFGPEASEAPIDTGSAFVTPEVTPEVVPGTGANCDTKGVPFDIRYCAQAADPFYGSGKQAGQWKKRKGVSEETYNAWYAEHLARLSATVGSTDEPEVNTAVAFGGVAATAAVTTNGPKNVGELMAWISEKQVAKTLNQDHLNAAYVQTGLGDIGALFPPKSEQEITQNINKLYSALVAVAGV